MKFSPEQNPFRIGSEKLSSRAWQLTTQILLQLPKIGMTKGIFESSICKRPIHEKFVTPKFGAILYHSIVYTITIPFTHCPSFHPSHYDGIAITVPSMITHSSVLSSDL